MEFSECQSSNSSSISSAYHSLDLKVPVIKDYVQLYYVKNTPDSKSKIIEKKDLKEFYRDRTSPANITTKRPHEMLRRLSTRAFLDYYWALENKSMP